MLRIRLIAMVLATTLIGCAEAPELPPDQLPKWHTNLKKAQEISRKTGRPILANFTGSDWCPPCQLLKKNVFHTAAFAAWAKESVVLLEVDFPRSKAQPPDLQAQNRALQERYKPWIKGVPTLLLMGAGGDVLGATTGYDRSTPEKWIQRMEAILAAERPASVSGGG